MAEDDFKVDWDKIDQRIGGDGTVALGQDGEFAAEFYMGKMPNADLTDYTEVVQLRLQAPGSKTVYDQPARLESHPNRPSDPERFPIAWQAFRAGHNMDGMGTSLTELDGITEGDIKRLELNGVRTIEHLARVSDNHLDGLGFGGRLLRDRARAFAAGRPAVDPEKAELKEQIGRLTGMVEQLAKGGPAIDTKKVDAENAELKDQVGKLTDILGALMEKTGISLDDLLPPATENEGEAAGKRTRQRQPAEA